jgi:hypothetical protein
MRSPVAHRKVTPSTRTRSDGMRNIAVAEITPCEVAERAGAAPAIYNRHVARCVVVASLVRFSEEDFHPDKQQLGRVSPGADGKLKIALGRSGRKPTGRAFDVLHDVALFRRPCGKSEGASRNRERMRPAGGGHGKRAAGPQPGSDRRFPRLGGNHRLLDILDGCVRAGRCHNGNAQQLQGLDPQ